MVSPVDNLQKISTLLKHAHTTDFAPNKFKYLCKAAKLQATSQLVEDAKNTYEQAKNANKACNDSSDLSHLLKLAKIAILIDPSKKPQELSQAEEQVIDKKNWALRDPQAKSILGNTYGPYFAKLADCFFKLNEIEPARNYLREAIDWSGRGYPRECLICYFKIAKACVSGNELDKFRTIFAKMEEMCPQIIHYSGLAGSTSWQLKMSELAYKVDKDYGKKLLASAGRIIERNPEEFEDAFNSTQKDKYQELLNIMQ